MISTCFRRTCCLLLLLLCLCTAGALAATPGALDPAFGVNGIVRTDLRDNDEQGAAVCKLPDGRFVVAGTSFVAAGTGDFALVRYFPDGSVDPSFGTGGFVLTDFVGRLDSASAIERLSDGRLIVAGYAIGNDGNRHVAFAQYLADGTLNSGFGAGGKLLGPVGFVSSLLVQPDGKLVVALKDGPDFIAHRYLPDGAQDAGFGNGGVATLNVYPGRTDISTASVLQPDGKILMAGTASTPSGAQLALGRLLSNGSPDPSFGTVGVTTYSFPSASSTLGNAVAVQPDGRILVAGTGLFPANQHFFMMRCQADGAPDGSFGTSGLAVTDFLAGDDAINTILLQPDGKIVAAGPCASELGGSFWDFGVARYLPDGTPDFQFGSFGKVRTDFGTGQRDEPFDLFVDDQAGLVAVGTVTSGVPGEGTIGLARYFLGNFWPVARDDAATTPEDTPLELSASLDPLANDTDANGDPLQLVLLAQPVHGEVTEAAGAWRYVPDPDFSGVDSFTYRPSDGQDQGKPATVRITVTAVNDAPVAQNDAYDLNEDAALTVAAPGVLSNDSDVDSGTLTAALVTAPASGVATISSTGRLTYTPLPNFSGLDTLQYRVSDGAALNNVATVSVTVHPVNDAPVVSAQSVTVDEDQTAAITLSGIDPDADPLSFSLVSVPLHGSLTGTPPNLIYRPSPNYFGPDSFTFRASDGNFQTGSALVAITVGPVNDSPTALPDNYTGVEDQALVVPPASGVLANDSDTDGNPVTAVLGAGPSHGTLNIGSDGSFTYQPTAGYFGLDSFTYRASDGSLLSGTTTVSLTLLPANDLPAASDQSVSAVEDTPLAITLVGTDPDGDALTFAVVGAPTRGTLSGSGANRLYTPQAEFNGTDTFRFQVSDGNGSSGIATVTVTVAARNDAPAAAGITVTVPEDGSASIALLGSDPDGDALTYTPGSLPTHGMLTGSGAGRTYTPQAGYSGPDSFTYRVSDGMLMSPAATVSISVSPVNDPPEAPDVAVLTDEDTSVAVLLLGSDPEGDSLQYQRLTEPQHGVLTGTAPDYTYTPAANYSGPDRFTYQVRDASAASRTVTVTITVRPVNDAPTAATDGFTVIEDTVLTASGLGVLANDTDVEGSPLTAALVSGVSHGTLSLASGGGFTYTPAPGYHGADSFTYRASDGALQSAITTVTLTVTAVNDAPSAAGQDLATAEDSARTFTLSGTDPEGDSLTYEVETGPAHGALTGTPPSLTYTPAPNYHGADSFTFRVRDDDLASAPATISITVTPVADPPTAAGQSVETAEDEGKALLLSGADPDGDPLTYQVTARPAHGTLTGTAPNLTYLPAANYSGADQLKFRVHDGTSLSAEATVQILVTPVNDPPTAAGETYTTPLSTPFVVAAPGLLANDTDPEGSALTVVPGAAPAHGTVVLGANGSVEYTPAVGYSGPDTFTYRVSDGALQSAPTTVTVQVSSAPPTATAGAVVKGSGTVLVGGSSSTFKINASVSSTGKLKGTFSFTSPTVKIKKATFTSLRVVSVSGGKAAQVYATVAVSRTETRAMLLQLEDRGAAPGTDRFGLSLSTGFSTGLAPLTSGSLSVTAPSSP